jgi:hypothetical protein
MLRIIVTVVESERFGGACATSGHERPRDGAAAHRDEVAAFHDGTITLHRAPLPLVSIFLHDGFRTTSRSRFSPLSLTTYFFTEISFATMLASLASRWRRKRITKSFRIG